MSSNTPPVRSLYANGLPEGRLTVVLPVFHTGKVLRRTLDALARQTLRDYSLLISMDNAGKDTSGTLPIVLKWLKQRESPARVEVFGQRRRLGWVANINFLLDQSGTRYVTVLPHDDIPLPEYLHRLYEAQCKHPEASVVYTDLRFIGRLPIMPGAAGRFSWTHWWDQWIRWTCLGGRPHICIQESIRGSRDERVKTMLQSHYNAPAFRGLLDKQILGSNLHLDPCGLGHFAADTTWMLKMALAGPMIRVPEVLYLKRGHRNNTHIAWMNGTKKDLCKLWLRHCRDCVWILRESAGSRPLLVREIRWVCERFLQRKTPLWVGRLILPGSRTKRRKMLRKLFGPFDGAQAGEKPTAHT